MPASFTSVVGFIALLFVGVLSGCSRDNPLTFPDAFVAADSVDCEPIPLDGLVLLKGITLSNGTISPKFNQAIRSYTLRVDYLVDSMTVTPSQVLTDNDENIENIKVLVDGQQVLFNDSSEEIALAEGVNEIVVSVDAAVKAQELAEGCVSDTEGVPSAEAELMFTLMVNRDRRSDVGLQVLSPSVAAIGSGDGFGRAVAIDGDTIVVGVSMEDSSAKGVYRADTLLSENEDDSAENSGAVYVYEKDSNGRWDFAYYIKASNAEAGDLFGASVSMSGEFLVVSAPGEDSLSNGFDGRQDSNQAPDSGAVYLFKRGVNQWEQLHYIKPQRNIPGADGYNDAFGQQVLIQNNTLLISAPKDDFQADDFGAVIRADSGAVLVYRYDLEDQAWRYQSTLNADVVRAGDGFGLSIAMDNNTIAVGAPGDDNGELTGVTTEVMIDQDVGSGSPRLDVSKVDSGAVYLFERSGGGAGIWAQKAYIKASNSDEGDLFGSAVALSDEYLVIGAKEEDSNGFGFDRNLSDNSLENSGAAYFYEPQNSTWVETIYIKSDRVQANSEFGSAIAFVNNDLFIGAPSHANVDQNSLGRVHEYSLADSILKLNGVRTSALGQTSEYFGNKLAVSGSTVVVGADGHDHQETGVTYENSGVIYVYR